MGDSCLGVAGFEVKVTPVGQATQTQRVVGPAPILSARACTLHDQITIQDLDVDASVTIDVRGYDGTGAVLHVGASKTIQSLRESPIHLQLEEQGPRPPLLVFQRNLDGAAPTDLRSITIARQMGGIDLLTVTRATAGAYLDPEPGAYGVRGLKESGGDEGVVLKVNYEVPGRTIPEQRITLHWNNTYYQGMP